MLRWLAEEGWIVAALLLMFVGLLRQGRRIRTIELRFQSIIERLTAAYQKIDTVDRRVTGKLEVGNEDATKLKKTMKKIKPEDFDDK